jgi:hypothetical protein
MKWFQQNRLLSISLIVFGVCVLLAGLLFYSTRNKWSDARQAFDKVAAERSRLQRLDPFPNDANYRKFKGYLENYSAALDKFKEELKKEVAPAPPLAPNEFQSRLRQAVIATLNRARTNNVKLPDKFQLGFDEFTTTLPKTAVAPLLGQELSQTQMLINILLDAKVDSVTSLHRAPLPEEGAASRTPVPKPTPAPARKASPTRGQKSAKPAEASATPSTATLMERNVVDLTFKAAPAAARKVLNEIANSTGQFFIIRTLYVHDETDKGPAREKGRRSKTVRDRNGIEFHRWQRAHRSLRPDRDAKVYFLTTNADSQIEPRITRMSG